MPRLERGACQRFDRARPDSSQTRSAKRSARLGSCRLATTTAPLRVRPRSCSRIAELLRRIEVVGGLVEQVDRRRLHQQARDGGAPLLAARQRGEFARAEGAEIHVGERARGALLVHGDRCAPRIRDARIGPSSTDSNSEPCGGASGSCGRKPSRVAIVRRGSAPMSLALEPHRAAGRRPQPRQRAQQQRLAGAVAAEQRNEFPAPKHAVELVDQHASWHRDAQLPGLENRILHLALIQRISSAVASPTRTSASDSGISKVCCIDARSDPP